MLTTVRINWSDENHENNIMLSTIESILEIKVLASSYFSE